jgi:hypothetical protein
MRMDAEAVYKGSPTPRRYSFKEHVEMYEQMQAEPAVSPDELGRVGGDPSMV